MRTEQEIQREIEALKVTRRKLNDYDWSQIIDIQINVLEHRMDYNEALEKFGREVSEKTLTLILYASNWLFGRVTKTNMINTIRQIKHLEIIDMLDTEINELNESE